MFNAFYAKLALANIRRDKRTYVPHIIATAVISGVYLLIAGLMFSYGLANLTSGKTTQAMFSFGMVVFSIFAFFFMLYVNNFLIGRRKREFGLYAVLGLEKRHVGRVLRWENLFTLGLGAYIGHSLRADIRPACVLDTAQAYRLRGRQPLRYRSKGVRYDACVLRRHIYSYKRI